MQANALGFIMQKEEDFTSEVVQEKVVAEYEEMLKLDMIKDPFQFHNIHSVIDLARKEKTIDFKELNMIGDLIPYLSEKGRDMVERNFQDFLIAVQLKAKKTDSTWQEVLKHFDCIPEMNKITDFMNDEEQLRDD